MENNNNIIHNLSDHDFSAIAARITYLRNNVLQMTQSQFAKLLNISQTYLSMLENGKKKINKDTIDLFIITFSLNFEWFVMGIGDDSNIFTSINVTREYLESCDKTNALSQLKQSYSLKPDEFNFIKRFLNLSKDERSKYIKASETIAKLFH